MDQIDPGSVTYGDFNAIVVEHESGVRAAEFVVVTLGESSSFNGCHIFLSNNLYNE